ncbi:MAG: DoxX family protein [Actinobacteria bacterium]|nr:DoxX family protein [Actinomycetota bacterium]
MIVRRLARPMLSAVFISGGIDTLRNPAPRARMAAPVVDKLSEAADTVVQTVAEKVPSAPKPSLPDDYEQLVKLNAAVMVGAGVLLASGRMPRLASAALAATLVPTTYAGHRFWELDEPKDRAQQQIHFMKNVSLVGGLILAAADTGGRPGVAWRARHARKDIRRARQTAALEAALATKAAATAARSRLSR